MGQSSRRGVLLGLSTVVLAGCLGDGSSSDAGTDGSGTPTDAPTATDEPSSTQTTDASGTATPTDDRTPAETPTPTETPTDERTPAETPTETPDPSLHADYEKTTVCVQTPEGEKLGCVFAAIADTGPLRYTGLSDTESLPEDRGMLFVYPEVQDLTFVMREMDFGIDIVYADDEGVITEIHHAPAPGPDENGNEQEYPGHGQYVLEVNKEWTTARGVEEGDVLQFEL